MYTPYREPFIADDCLSYSNDTNFASIEVGDFVAALIQAADGAFVSASINLLSFETSMKVL